jgi:hypothetical protein
MQMTSCALWSLGIQLDRMCGSNGLQLWRAAVHGGVRAPPHRKEMHGFSDASDAAATNTRSWKRAKVTRLRRSHDVTHTWLHTLRHAHAPNPELICDLI